MLFLCSGCSQRGEGCRGERLLGEEKKSHEGTRPSDVSLAKSSVNGVQPDWEKHEMDTWEGKVGRQKRLLYVGCILTAVC